MKKVWIVTSDCLDYEGGATYINGVFDDKNNAEKYIKKTKKYNGNMIYYIKEYEVQ